MSTEEGLFPMRLYLFERYVDEYEDELIVTPFEYEKAEEVLKDSYLTVGLTSLHLRHTETGKYEEKVYFSIDSEQWRKDAYENDPDTMFKAPFTDVTGDDDLLELLKYFDEVISLPWGVTRIIVVVRDV